MALTDTKTDKVPGRITHVYLGRDSTNGVDISSGIKSFEYERVHDAVRYEYPGDTTSTDLFQKSSSFKWKLEFISDCRVAFFATDISMTAGSQYALVDNGHSNKIDYFRVIVPIIDGAGASKTRTYTITNGYALRNQAFIGDDEDAVYTYEGVAEYISYSDA